MLALKVSQRGASMLPSFSGIRETTPHLASEMAPDAGDLRDADIHPNL